MLPSVRFADYIKKNALFTKDDKILLAVSGGKDSVLMAQLFKLTGFEFSIAHCNFNLRGVEAQRDETFVKLLAASLEVPFFVAHFDTNAYANEHHVSTQMAARTLRYQWFEQLRVEIGYHYIAVAHHQNDSVETLLLNLTRGTGISGLHGILPKREYLVRPLLFLSRHEIDELIDENHFDFVEDSSNETTKYARNKIRLQVIPHLREINPKLEQTFAQNIKYFAETEEVLKQVVEQKRKELSKIINDNIYFPIQEIKSLYPQNLLFYELLRPFNFSSFVIEEVLMSLNKQSGTSFYSQTHRLTINRDDLVISSLENKPNQHHYFIHQHDHLLQIAEQTISFSITESNAVESNNHKAFVDASKLIFPLIVRFRQDGDRFMPLGMKQFKKLSDFLINCKVPLPQKEIVPLLVNGNGEIIWVAGLRQDNRYKVNATTKKVAIFELSNQLRS